LLSEPDPEVERTDASPDWVKVESVHDLFDEEFVGAEARLDAKACIEAD